MRGRRWLEWRIYRPTWRCEVIITAGYLAMAPHAQVSITYPDGAKYECRVLADGNGVLAADIRCAAYAVVPGAERRLSKSLDALRASACKAGRAWAVSK